LIRHLIQSITVPFIYFRAPGEDTTLAFMTLPAFMPSPRPTALYVDATTPQPLRWSRNL